MNKEELKSKKIYNKLLLDTSKTAKILLEHEKIVMEYLKRIEIIEREQEYQAYLNRLEIGQDGVVFSPYEEHQTNAFKRTHFGLSEILKHAFYLESILNNEQESFLEYYSISFANIQKYIENAYNILTDMNYVEGDRLVKNPYNLEIYENPKNYSLVDFNALQPFNSEKLRISYDVPEVSVMDNYFVAQKESILNFKPRGLTKREEDAFYGENAKKSLEYLPSRKKEKIKSNT